MVAEFGVFCLVVVLLTALIQFSYLLCRPMRGVIGEVMPTTAWLQALCASLALAGLIIVRIESDFTVANVVMHSNRSMPLLYKIVGAWGNHEGSMLLWLLYLTLFGCVLALRPMQDKAIRHMALSMQSGLIAATCGFILFTSNPFTRVFPPPHDGQTLNPILQDAALALHPPLLYLGYVGFSLVFSLAFAALIHGRAGQEWARLAQPWILFAWSALTIGIGLGSWWAYRELGWGGWWFWDPVENASLLPWLAGLALLHSNIALKKRGALGSWVVLLAILTFALSLIGTFLVRSGALVSVHSFASDPTRGLYILMFIVITVGSALVLFALRGSKLQSQENIVPLSREGMMLLNNVFLIAACASVLLGTIYPLFVDWFKGQPVSVGAPYFNKTFLPLMGAPVLLAAAAPFLSWKQGFMKQLRQQGAVATTAVFGALFLVIAYVKTDVALAMAGFGLAAWLAASSVALLVKKRNVQLLPVSIAHLGVALLVAGITGEGLWKTHGEAWLNKGDKMEIGGYEVILRQYQPVKSANYQSMEAELSVMRGNREIAQLKPEYRRYDIAGTVTNEAAIYSDGLSDIYAVIGELSDNKKRLSARIYYVPMIACVWLGFAFMAAGGILSFLQTRKGPISCPN